MKKSNKNNSSNNAMDVQLIYSNGEIGFNQMVILNLQN